MSFLYRMYSNLSSDCQCTMQAGMGLQGGTLYFQPGSDGALSQVRRDAGWTLASLCPKTCK